MRRQIQSEKNGRRGSVRSTHHVEILPYASVLFSCSTLADSEEAPAIVRTAMQSATRFHRFGLVANFSAAISLTVGSITLQIYSADSYPQNHTQPR